MRDVSHGLTGLLIRDTLASNFSRLMLNRGITSWLSRRWLIGLISQVSRGSSILLQLSLLTTFRFTLSSAWKSLRSVQIKSWFRLSTSFTRATCDSFSTLVVSIWQLSVFILLLPAWWFIRTSFIWRLSARNQREMDINVILNVLFKDWLQGLSLQHLLVLFLISFIHVLLIMSNSFKIFECNHNCCDII